MILYSILFILGCIMLYYGSEFLINHSVSISQRFGVLPIVIGATVIAFGTSLPELLVSMYSIIFIDSSNSTSGIIMGNILGSNIANVSLVLGYCGFMYSIILNKNLLDDILFPFVLGLYVLICLYFNITINYVHGIILLFSLLIYIYLLIKNNKIDDEDIEDNLSSKLSWHILVIISSIMVLVLGSHLVVDNATKIAEFFKINTLTIGVTIIALGTSLPELFTGVIAIKKKQYNLLIGNIVGSNILNIVFVLGFSSIIIDIKPIIEPNKLLYISIALIISHLILILAYLYNSSISKFSGFILLLVYLIFLYKIF